MNRWKLGRKPLIRKISTLGNRKVKKKKYEVKVSGITNQKKFNIG